MSTLLSHNISAVTSTGASSAVWTCLALVIIATITDIKTRRIPNTITISGIVIGLGLHLVVGWIDGGALSALRALGLSLAGLVACSVVPMLGFIRRDMGGGDVKLFAAIGALSGPLFGLDIQGFTFAITLVVVLPWRLLTRKKGVKLLRPVIMAPTILAGLLLAIARHVWLAALIAGGGELMSS